MTRRVTRKRVPPKGTAGVLVEYAEKPKEAQLFGVNHISRRQEY